MKHFLILFLVYSVLFGQDNFYEMEAKQKIATYQKWQNAKSATPIQNEFDVHFYELNMDFGTSVNTVEGMVDVHFTALSPINQIELDFQNIMTVDSVKLENIILNYNHTNALITIDLDRTYSSEENGEIQVYYHGSTIVPNLPFGSFTYEGESAIWSLSQPYGGRVWWPSKDIPEDKADSMDINFTVPLDLIVASNGRLADTTTHTETRTWHWESRYPISTYLVSIAAYPYKTYTKWFVHSGNDSMPIEFYVAPSNYEASLPIAEETVQIMGVFNDLFGEYPFIKEKYGHAEAFPFFSAMEHQTCSSYGMQPSVNGVYPYTIGRAISHELAHQWWGDMITCKNFHHMWLNEGFATYSEALYFEVVNGTQAYHDNMATKVRLGSGTVYAQDSLSNGSIFSILVYDKGSWVLHMLRKIVGDDDFFEILKSYHQDIRYKYKTATTENFQEIAETISGINLGKFFQQWIYTEYYPQYATGYTVDTLQSGYQLNVVIEQIQENTGLFWMPLDIEVTTASGSQIFVAWDSVQSDTFSFKLNEYPDSVEIDPENWVLKTVRQKIIAPPLDSGVLLVNGLSWRINEVVEGYENKSYWGEIDIDFWDLSDPPSTGYPATLPEPLGNGELPAKVMANYSTVFWLSDKRGKDLEYWNNIPYLDYLNEGGKIILITQQGSTFISDSLASYAGIKWAKTSSLLASEYKSTHSDLNDMASSKSHALISLMDTIPTKPYSNIIFKETISFDSTLANGIWASPPNKGQFIYIAGRPYYFNHDDLSANMEKIIVNNWGEVTSIADDIANARPKQFRLMQNYPNPFNPKTTISYHLSNESHVLLTIYDILGRKVKTLVNVRQKVGKYKVIFNAAEFASGVYYYRLDSGSDYIQTRKLILLK